MISFVYFDLGGVIEIDFSGNNGWEDLKKELGVNPEDYPKFDAIYAEYDQRICTNMDIEHFKEVLNHRLNLHIPHEYSLMNGFVSRFEKNPSIWPVINEMHTNCKVGVLTMIYPGMYASMKHAGILPEVDWDVILDSSEVGLTKLQDELFDLATVNANVAPQQILYVENTQNILIGLKSMVGKLSSTTQSIEKNQVKRCYMNLI